MTTGLGAMLQETSGSLGTWHYMQYLGMDTSNQDLGNRKEVIAFPAVATWGRQQHRNVIAEKSGWVGRALGGWAMVEGIGVQSPAGGIWKIRVP